MADSIHAQITASIKSACELVTVANGYNTACGTVEQERSRFIPSHDTPYTMIKWLPKDLTEDYDHTEDNFYRYSILYFLWANDEAEGSDPMQYLYRNVGPDFQKALMIDRTRGGVALNTTIDQYGTATYIDDDGNSFACAYVNVTVQALVDADNPDLVAG